MGFFSVLGEIGSTAGVTYTSALIISQYVLLGSGGADNGGTLLDQVGSGRDWRGSEPSAQGCV